MNSTAQQHTNKFNAWMIWLLAAVFSLFQFFLQVSGNMLEQPLMQSFHLNHAGLGALNSAFFYGYVLVQIPAGILYDKYHLRKVCITAIVICGLGTLWFALSHTLASAIVSRILMGSGAGFAFVGMVYAAAEGFSTKAFPILVGAGELIAMLGAAAGQRFAPLMVIHSGWRELMLLCAGIAFVLMLLMFFFMRTPAQHHCEGRLLHIIWRNFKQVAPVRNVWLAGLFCCGFFGIVSGFAALWGVPFLMNVQGLSFLQSTSTMAWILLGIAIGGPITGWLGGHWRFMPTVRLCGLFACISLLIVMFVPIHYVWAIKAILFFAGFCCSSYVLAFSIVERSLESRICGTGIGVCNSMALLGAIVFQPLSGGLLTTLRHTLSVALQYQLALLILPIVMVLALAGTFWICPKRCRLTLH